MTDALISPLVLTKLRLPAARPRNIPRGHLIERLNVETRTDLVLVCAPAGYGKTTLLVEWAHALERNGIIVAWYALDPSDDDPIPFGSYLVASLIHAMGPITELTQVAQRLHSSPEIDLQQILPAIINTVISRGQECVLILDDYHFIGDPAIHSAMAYLLEHLPENLRIAIGSRSDPPLPLARLRAHAQLLETRTADLRFSPDEACIFLNEVMHLELPLDLVAELEKRTEGWVTGLQLAALSLSDRADKDSFIASFAGSHRYLVEYLMEEVINRLPDEVRSFLLETSVLERLCAPLCDALLNKTANSEAIIARLDQANLFVIALDDQGYWYRYHHLFRDFLQTRLNKEQPGRINELHRLACEWLAAHEFLREAARHAFLTHDWEYAAAFVEQHSFTMVIHSDISTIHEWCSAFPEEVMQEHPLLCIHQCWALVLSFRRQNRDRVEARLRAAEQAAARLDDEQRVSELNGYIEVIRSLLALMPVPAADPRELLSLSQSMLEAYPEGEPGQFSALLTSGYAHMALHDAQAASLTLETARQIALRGRLFFGIVESTFHLARLAQTQGQLTHAADLCRQGQADIAAMLAYPEQELPALGCLDIALGCVLLEQDRLEEAEQALLHGHDLIGWSMNPYYQMTAIVALFRLREIQDRSVEALDLLARLDQSWPDISFCTKGLRIVHSLRTAPLETSALAEAAAWCKDFSPTSGDIVFTPGIGPFGAAEVYFLAHLAWTRTQIAMGNPQAALSYLERQLDLALSHGLTNRVIELLLLEAQARQVEGNKQRSWAALERALALAEPAGYVRIFDQGPVLTQLLSEAANHGIFREYIARILVTMGQSKDLTARQDRDAGLLGTRAHSPKVSYLESGEHISERELTVLHLMARGASNMEIAEQLVITVGTVKSHINHILGKLDAHNRTEAVARARGMGLLDL